MCGFEFQKTDTLCSHGCPLGSMCSLSRCPSCEYEFPKTPKTLSWLARVFRKTEGRALDLPEHVRTLRELKAGERGRVMCLGAKSDRDNSLAVFGLAPGAEIMLVAATTGLCRSNWGDSARAGPRNCRVDSR